MGEGLKGQGYDFIGTRDGKKMPQTGQLEEVEGTCLVTVKDKTCRLTVCAQVTGLLLFCLALISPPRWRDGKTCPDPAACFPTGSGMPLAHPAPCTKACLCLPRADVSLCCRARWPQIYDACLNISMRAVVPLADASSIRVIPVHPLLRGSC